MTAKVRFQVRVKPHTSNISIQIDAGTMTSCGGAEDDMKNFTEAVNMYDPAGFDTPPDVTGRLIADFSSLVHKAETSTAIGTIMTDVEEEGRYPLLGTKSESRLMPSINEHIGEGTTGHVYSIATRFGPMAVKFQEHSSGSGQAFVPGNGSMNVPMNEFALEVKFQLHMSSIGISPNVYNAWTGAYSTTWGDGQQDVLVMDRLKETLFQKTSRERDYTGGVMELVSKMHDNNVFHGDMHSGNIMVDGSKPWMIDFGKSKPMPATDEGKRWAMVHDYVLLYTSLLRRSELKPIIKNKILELAPAKTVMGTAFDLGE